MTYDTTHWAALPTQAVSIDVLMPCSWTIRCSTLQCKQHTLFLTKSVKRSDIFISFIRLYATVASCNQLSHDVTCSPCVSRRDGRVQPRHATWCLSTTLHSKRQHILHSSLLVLAMLTAVQEACRKREVTEIGTDTLSVIHLFSKNNNHQQRQKISHYAVHAVDSRTNSGSTCG